MSQHETRVAVLASGDRESGGGGSTMERFIRDTQASDIDIEVGLVICNNPRGTVGVYDRVDGLNLKYGLDIEVLTINGITHPDGKQTRGQTLEESSEICAQAAARDIGDFLLLGYMKSINGELMDKFGWKPEYQIVDPKKNGIYLSHITNTHPGILPATADTHGSGASEEAIRQGLSHTAHTLHVVAAGIDTGPNIAEHLVAISPDDTAEILFQKVQDTEKSEITRAMDSYYKAQREFLGKTVIQIV